MVLLWSAVLAGMSCLFPGGLDATITGVRGESLLFPAPHFKSDCKWAFLGNQKSKRNGADILYSDGTNCPDQDFGEYQGRIGESCNGTLFIKTLLPKDAGWYRLHCDMKPEPDFYLLKLVDPVCNISIALIPSENDVQLQCKSTGNKNYEVFWTHAEKNLTGYEIFPGNLSVPRDKACGYFQCNILCGVLGLQKTGINLTYSDTPCNISIALIPPENGVRLPCNNTYDEVFLTDNRKNPTGNEILPGTLDIPFERACRYSQCNILCGVSRLQQASINLIYSDCKAESGKSLEIGLGVGVTCVTCLVLVLIGICYCWKRRWIGERITARNANHRGGDYHRNQNETEELKGRANGGKTTGNEEPNEENSCLQDTVKESPC